MLEIEGIKKSYRGTEVLKGIDLTVAPGEILGLLGPNGAGKTTLVSIVAGLRRADDGSVRIDGIDVRHRPDRARRLLGLAPQELGIYPTLTGEQNLRFFGELAGLRGLDLRRRIHEVAEALELVPLLERRAGVLSGGQQRRLHTAMALVHEPRLLFLDEPTVGADVHSRASILEVVKALAAGGAAICYATHYLQEVETLGATVAVLEKGRIIARAPLDELVVAHGSPAVRLVFDGDAPSLPGFDRDGRVAVRHTDDPARAAASVLTSLGPLAERVEAVEVVHPSLEAAYLALTGRTSNEQIGEEEEDRIHVAQA